MFSKFQQAETWRTSKQYLDAASMPLNSSRRLRHFLSVKVIYNATAYKDEKDERIRKLLKFICTNEPGDDDFSIRLSAVVEKIKENEKFRREYAAMNLHDWDITRAAKKEGIAEGAHNKAVETARKMLEKSIPLETVAECTGLPEEEIALLK